MAFISSFTYLSSALFGGSAGKESACNVGDVGLIPGWGRSAGEGKGYSLQYSGQENSMDYIVQGVAKSQTRLSDFHFLLFFILGFPDGSVGKESACRCRRPGFDPWVGKIPWRRERLLTPVVLPAEFHGQRSLVDSKWGHKESDAIERPTLSLSHSFMLETQLEALGQGQ